MKGDEQRCLDAGCDGYLSKPIDPDQLLDVIARHLASPEAAQPSQPAAEEAPKNLAAALSSA